MKETEIWERNPSTNLSRYFFHLFPSFQPNIENILSGCFAIPDLQLLQIHCLFDLTIHLAQPKLLQESHAKISVVLFKHPGQSNAMNII